MERRLLICQNRTCRKQGSRKVLAIFQQHPVPGVEVKGCGCLGQCGNGPMVLVLPDGVWYGGVRADEVPTIVERHLRHDTPVTGMLYWKFHGDRP